MNLNQLILFSLGFLFFLSSCTKDISAPSIQATLSDISLFSPNITLSFRAIDDRSKILNYGVYADLDLISAGNLQNNTVKTLNLTLPNRNITIVRVEVSDAYNNTADTKVTVFLSD